MESSKDELKSPQGFKPVSDLSCAAKGAASEWATLVNRGDLISRISGSSNTILERHLQKCIQALLAVYQDELYTDDLNEHNSKQKQEWLDGFIPLSPDEIPIEVPIKGNRVQIKESFDMCETLATIEGNEVNKQRGRCPDGNEPDFSDVYMKNLSALQGYLDTLFKDAFVGIFQSMIEAEGVKTRKLNNVSGFSAPKKEFIQALDHVMAYSEHALGVMANKYHSLTKVQPELLEATQNSRF